MPNSNSNFVYQDLCRAEPTLKLLYLTPEKLNLSEKLTKILTSLYNRDMIARLVIDEAHCVSNWGHDFRKDYTQLGALRNRLFPNVPVMLLTATATPRVRKDILIQMSLSCDENLFNKSNAFEGIFFFLVFKFFSYFSLFISDIQNWKNLNAPPGLT